ncbi:hypothetical protein [Flavobacterium hydatis]|uniref:Uncharacterized protein n=1 Tax=Flavobacterium hydatis TaxID=991 RepID=A0A085ZTG8_FLAHY|nr:hypothetical protein [Flavobacterium hydatis]KFF07732.1 hypothetical protein IW20_24250 [Flavobacterium hydatis]OXA92365.1 hypothetical protein B0A62_15940 [Flavobacterium hydatis]
MSTIENETLLRRELSVIDKKLNKLNDEKIKLFFNAIGLNARQDIPKDYLQWETILIVVPNRQVSHELKPYKYSISRITFVTNVYAKEIHIYDFNDWKKAFGNKTHLQIKNALKDSFGGVQKVQEEYIKTIPKNN